MATLKHLIATYLRENPFSRTAAISAKFRLPDKLVERVLNTMVEDGIIHPEYGDVITPQSKPIEWALIAWMNEGNCAAYQSE